jgi:hypothetical protein
MQYGISDIKGLPYECLVSKICSAYLELILLALIACKSIYGSTALLLDLGRFSVFLFFTQSVGLPGRGISPSQGSYLHRQDSTNIE